MKRLFLLFLFFLTACFHHDSTEKKIAEKDSAAAEQKPLVEVKEAKTPSMKDHELLRFARYLEQADAVHREAWWVVAAERKVQGKSIFGKAQRALQSELGVKLGNKSLFRCDRYIVKREILSPLGVPQKGEIYEKCSQANADLIADFSLSDKTHGEINFYPQHLDEVMGLQTSILNRKVHCVLEGDEEGKLDSLHCENMAQDRNGTQSIQFSVYDYQKSGKNLVTLKGQVYESLSPTRKIEAQVPMEGKIHVVETQVEAPEGYVKPGSVPVVKPATVPSPKDQVKTRGRNSHQVTPPPPVDAVQTNPGALEGQPAQDDPSAVEFSDQPAAGGARAPTPTDPDMMIYQQQTAPGEVAPAQEAAPAEPVPAQNPEPGAQPEPGQPEPSPSPEDPSLILPPQQPSVR